MINPSNPPYNIWRQCLYTLCSGSRGRQPVSVHPVCEHQRGSAGGAGQLPRVPRPHGPRPRHAQLLQRTHLPVRGGERVDRHRGGQCEKYLNHRWKIFTVLCTKTTESGLRAKERVSVMVEVSHPSQAVTTLSTVHPYHAATPGHLHCLDITLLK